MNNSILSPPSDRGLGRMIDVVIYMVFTGVFGSIAYAAGVSFGAVWVIAALILYGAETALVATGGGSIGKRIVGEEITDRNGQPISWSTAALRTTPRLLYVHPIGMGLGVALGAVSAAMIYATEDRRSAMDVAARTVVRRVATGSH